VITEEGISRVKNFKVRECFGFFSSYFGPSDHGVRWDISRGSIYRLNCRFIYGLGRRNYS
jgi:hypothetical protein